MILTSITLSGKKVMNNKIRLSTIGQPLSQRCYNWSRDIYKPFVLPPSMLYELINVHAHGFDSEKREVMVQNGRELAAMSQIKTLLRMLSPMMNRVYSFFLYTQFYFLWFQSPAGNYGVKY